MMKGPTLVAICTPLAAAALIACGPRPADPTSTPRIGAGGECYRLVDETPELPPPNEVPTPTSKLVVGASVDVELIQRELGKRVPVVLATARRKPVGSPGEATYTVRRRGFGVRVVKNRVVVSTEVNARIEVCKPIGPFCPTYGRCAPKLVAEVSVPWKLSPDYRIGKSRAALGITTGCVIAVYDATPDLRRIGGEQMAAIRSRIDRDAPRLDSYVREAWKFLHVPVSLGATTCLRAKPRRLVQGTARVEDGMLRLPVGAELDVEVDDSCDAKNDPKPSGLPPLAHAAELGETRVQVPIRIAWSAVGADLTRSLNAVEVDGAKISKVTARGAKGPAPIVLDIEFEGSLCGSVSLRAGAKYDPTESRLRLTRLTLVPGQPERMAALSVDEWTRAIENSARIRLPIDAAGAPAHLQNRVSELAALLPEPLTAEIEMHAPAIESVLASPSALVPILLLAGRAEVFAR